MVRVDALGALRCHIDLRRPKADIVKDGEFARPWAGMLFALRIFSHFGPRPELRPG